jgi:hypothetical protein
MALTYLSGDFDAVGKRKKTSGGGGGGGGSKRRTGGAGNKRVKKTKVEKNKLENVFLKRLKSSYCTCKSCFFNSYKAQRFKTSYFNG